METVFVFPFFSVTFALIVTVPFFFAVIFPFLSTAATDFLPDVYVPCEVCGGTRYNRETLEIKYKGKSIYDVLEMRVEEALEFFENIPKVRNKLQMLMDV